MDLIAGSRRSDRRVLGAAVLVLALVVAVILPLVEGRAVAGNLVRSAEPVVGDCVLVSDVLQVFGDAGSQAGRVGRPSAVRTDCGTPGAATVIGRSVAQDRMPAELTRGEYLGYRSGCRGAAEQARREFRGDQYTWQPGGFRVTFESVVLLAAEAATPQVDGHVGNGGDLCYAMALAGDAFAPTVIPVGRPGDALGICQLRGPGEQDRGGSTSCRDPHDIEFFGRVVAVSMPGSGSGSSSEVPAACRDYLVHVTGMTDPTASGQLRVTAQSGAARSGSVPGEPSRPVEADRGPGVDSVCGLVVATPGRTLTGSLVDRGDRPLPWR